MKMNLYSDRLDYGVDCFLQKCLRNIGPLKDFWISLHTTLCRSVEIILLTF